MHLADEYLPMAQLQWPCTYLHFPLDYKTQTTNLDPLDWKLDPSLFIVLSFTIKHKILIWKGDKGRSWWSKLWSSISEVAVYTDLVQFSLTGNGTSDSMLWLHLRILYWISTIGSLINIMPTSLGSRNSPRISDEISVPFRAWIRNPSGSLRRLASSTVHVKRR